MSRLATTPLISVVMPVFNAETYLMTAIESILSQSLDDFEFIIINDGSRDSSKRIITSYDDPRIVYLENIENRGLIYSLNRGIETSRGYYIARMDADDLSYPDRLKIQVAFLNENPDVSICGCWVEMDFGGNRPRVVLEHPEDHQALEVGLLFHNVLAHPSVMMRKSVFADSRNLYSEQYKNIEDYELWVRLIRRFKIANIPIPLVRYRIHPEQVSASENGDQIIKANHLRLAYLRSMGILPSTRESDIHTLFINKALCRYAGESADVIKWLKKIQKMNGNFKALNGTILNRMIKEQLFFNLKRFESLSLSYLSLVLFSFDFKTMTFGYVLEYLKLIGKCVIGYTRKYGSN